MRGSYTTHQVSITALFGSVLCRLLAVLCLMLIPAEALGQTTKVTKDGSTITAAAPTKSIRPTYASRCRREAVRPLEAAPVLWVVARSEMRDSLQALLHWRRTLGIRVEEFYFDTHRSDSIHAALQRRYDAAGVLSPRPDYLLVVGDIDKIAAFVCRQKPSGELTSYVTDLYFGEFTGDYYPEAAVGRLPAADAVQLHTMIDKMMRYERLSDGTDHLSRALLVAGQESRSPAPVTTDGQVGHLATLLASGAQAMDTHCLRQALSANGLDSVCRLLTSGMGLVNYTAHGNIHGWLNPTLTYSITDTLPDSTAALYINNCCYANNYAVDCMGTHLLRKARGGAVAVMGATNSALWEEDYLWNVGGLLPPQSPAPFDLSLPGALGRRIRTEDLHPTQWALTLGEIMQAGCSAVTTSGSIFDGYYWELYNLLGDPTMMPYLGAPTSLDGMPTEPLLLGQTEVTLSGTPYAYAALSDSTGLLGSAYLDSSGQGTIVLCRAIAARQLTLALTGKNAAPLVETLTAAVPAAGQLAVTGYEYRDDSLRLTLRNVGGDSCRNHHAVLLQHADDSLTAAWIAAPVETAVGFLAPDQTTTVSLPLTVVRWNSMGNTAWVHVAFSDNTGIYAEQRVAVEMAHRAPAVVAVMPMQNGRPARRPLQASSYEVLTVFDNPTNDTLYCSIPGTAGMVMPHRRDTLTCLVQTADGQHHITLSITMQATEWQRDTTVYMIIGGDIENFESGDLSCYPWDNETSPHPWEFVTDITHSGNYALRSGSIGHRQRSELALDIYLPFDDTLFFYCRASTEENGDYLLFSVDGLSRGAWSGNMGWSRSRTVLTAGHHRLVWCYSKDDGVTRGDDRVWIDDITLPLAVWDNPYGTPGSVVIGGQPEQYPVKLLPNPASQILVINGIMPQERRSTTAVLVDNMGRFIRTIDIDGTFVGDLATGLYYVTLCTPQRTMTLKLLVNH